MSDFVYLRLGHEAIDMPVEALKVAWALEDRGATFQVKRRALIVSGVALTDTDRAQIRQWKRHIMTMVTTYPTDLELWWRRLRRRRQHEQKAREQENRQGGRKAAARGTTATKTEEPKA